MALADVGMITTTAVAPEKLWSAYVLLEPGTAWARRRLNNG